jgi:kynurenine formamidase
VEGNQLAQTRSRPKVPEDVVIGYFDSMSNWGRWGKDDEIGALNLVTPAKVRAAAALVESGVRVSCARVIEWAPKARLPEATVPPIHFMQRSGESAHEHGMDSAFDWAGLPLHGLHVTHLDAFSHVFWNAKMYNGRPANQVVADRGARAGAVDLAHDGVVTRGILLDIPRARGVKWLEDGEGVYGEDMVRAEELTGTQVEPGDVLYVRTGYGARRPGSSDDLPGLTADCLEFIHARQPAIVATDSGTDAFPSGYESMGAPVHCVSMVAMGIWIIDNCDLEGLAVKTAELGRWHFLTTISPLRLKNSTGSPVNPIAVF